MADWRLMRRVLDLADKTAETLGPFIAGDRPDDPILGPYHDYTRWVCDSYANIPAWATGLVGTGAASWLGLERSIGQTCRPYLGSNAPGPDVPFTGGQCPVLYTVTVTGNFPGAPGGVGTATRVGLGPVEGVCWGSATVHGTHPVGVRFATGCVTGGSGYGSTYTANLPSLHITNIVRNDGQPDNCGNLRPTQPTRKPGAPPDPGPNPPGGGQPPTWSPRGPVFHPGPIKSPYDEPDSPVPPIDPWNPRGGGPDDPFYGPDHPKPGDPGEPGNSEETTDGGEVDGEVPDGHELVSLLVEVTHSPNGANKYSGVYYRAVCWVFMGNEEGLDMDYAGSMMGDHQLVLAETSGLTHWRVKANLGYSVRVTPFSREVESS